jgi:hypothetical protein
MVGKSTSQDTNAKQFHSIHTSPVLVPGRPAKLITPNKLMMMIERHRQSLSLASLVLACFLWEISLSCQLCITNGSQATTFAAARLLFGQERQLQRTTAFFLDIASNTHPNPGRKLTFARHLGPMVADAIGSPQAEMSSTNAVPSIKTQRLLQNYAMMVPKRKGMQLLVCCECCCSKQEPPTTHSGQQGVMNPTTGRKPLILHRQKETVLLLWKALSTNLALPLPLHPVTPRPRPCWPP